MISQNRQNNAEFHNDSSSLSFGKQQSRNPNKNPTKKDIDKLVRQPQLPLNILESHNHRYQQ